MRRAGYSSEQRVELKRLYRFLFRSDRRMRQAAEEARSTFTSAEARLLLDFVEGTHRGICADTGRVHEEHREGE
jgi:acyl-[acyl carrier protein]--UDP-N-acetylglucosamine O-acyltransferase